MCVGAVPVDVENLTNSIIIKAEISHSVYPVLNLTEHIYIYRYIDDDRLMRTFAGDDETDVLIDAQLCAIKSGHDIRTK